jgi:hypothetical protein
MEKYRWSKCSKLVRMSVNYSLRKTLFKGLSLLVLLIAFWKASATSGVYKAVNCRVQKWSDLVRKFRISCMWEHVDPSSPNSICLRWRKIILKPPRWPKQLIA